MPDSSAVRRPASLPVELTSFVGRSRELLEIRRLLAVARTVTLTGPGGIGKSRLALNAAHRLERHFPDGVWWVELAELDSPDLTSRRSRPGSSTCRERRSCSSSRARPRSS